MASPTIRLRHSVSSILRVYASWSTSAITFKDTRKSLAEIGRELNVQFVVEGSVRSEGRLLRTRCTLNRASDQVQLWSQSFDRELTSLLDVQRELSVVIADRSGFSSLPNGWSRLLDAIRGYGPHTISTCGAGDYGIS